MWSLLRSRRPRLANSLLAGFVAACLISGTVIGQVTGVLNPASDLSGRTLLTAEGSYTVSGVHTWSVPIRLSTGTTGSPGIVSSGDQTTGWRLGTGLIGGSLAGTQRMLLDSTGLTIYGTLIVNSSGVLQGNLVPSGAIFYFNSACPAGYTEFTNARGNVIVGNPSGGTLNTQVGTALTNLENRPVGQHNHGITDPGHAHNVILFGHQEQDGGGALTSEVNAGGNVSANGAAQGNVTGITINNAGSVAGTNAPYIQLTACQKT